MSGPRAAPPAGLGWLGIVRLGLVQASLGAIIILTTTTLNRIMVVELALPAMLPGLLVGLHYGVQLSRPQWGHGADTGGARSPWIFGGMVVLALGAMAAALSTALMAGALVAGIIGAVIAFVIIGIGVGAAGTNLLALLAAQTAPDRKAAAAAIVWIMMIVGFVLTATLAGPRLDPFTMTRLIQVCAAVCLIAVSVTGLALWRLERPRRPAAPTTSSGDKPAFRTVFAEIWAEPQARRFTVFVFVAMLAYSAQDLILEPFAGLVYGYSPGESTSLAGVQNGGVLIGMIVTAIVGTTIGKSRAGFMRLWTVGGCLASAAALGALALAALIGPAWKLEPLVFALGLANGAFTVAAIGSMMALASTGAPSREGIRMGLWGASQAVAFGIGGFLGALALDAMRALIAAPAHAFATVFAVEGALFAVAGALALWVGASAADRTKLPALPAGEALMTD